MGKVFTILLLSSILAKCHGQLEPLILCLTTPYNQTFQANNFGTIRHELIDEADINCELTLDVSGYNSPLAITNIVRNTDCYDNETARISINNAAYCIRESNTSLEVISLDQFRQAKISLITNVPAFTLQYYIANLLCQHGKRLTITLGADFLPSLTSLYLSPGYIQELHLHPVSRCEIWVHNHLRVAVLFELVFKNWTQESIETRIHQHFHWRLQEYNSAIETNDFHMYFDTWDTDFSKQIFIRITVLSCGTLPEIKNGYHANASSSPWLPGAVVEIGCILGYEHFNKTQMYAECVLTGGRADWALNIDDPVCVPVKQCMELPPKIEMASYSLTADNLTARYQCILGTASVAGIQAEQWECSSTDINEIPWKWTRVGKQLNCSVQCPLPPQIANGFISSNWTSKSYFYADELSYECDEGFTIFREMITCQQDGDWSPAPFCHQQSRDVVQCPPPPKIANGFISANWTSRSYFYADQLSYECEEGFTIFRKTITCQQDGDWSPAPFCHQGRDVDQTTATSTTVIGLSATLAVVTLVLIGLAAAVLVMWKRKLWTRNQSQRTFNGPADSLQSPDVGSPNCNTREMTPFTNLPTLENIYENTRTPTGANQAEGCEYEEVSRVQEEHLYEKMPAR